MQQHVVPERDLREKLLPLLNGRAFHVTSARAYALILGDGAVRPNDRESFEANFAFSQLSYFREKGCISVCDLRAVDEEDLERGLQNYNCLRPKDEWTSIAYLVLGDQAQRKLITWSQAVEEGGSTIQGVPRIESGYPGPLPVEELEEVILVELTPDPWLEQFRAAVRGKR